MPENLFDIAGQVAVVTGGTGVLGGAMARGLAARGAKVVVLGRSEEKGAAVVGSIQSAGGEAKFLQSDVTNSQQCQELASQVAADFGKIDLLVNAAGGNHPQATANDEQAFFDLPPEALSHVMGLNILGTFYPCQSFGRVMSQQKNGTIVNISSMAALQPLTKVVGYSASKAAVTNFTYWLSVYMNQKFSADIRVNAIAPGFFLTEQNRFLLTEKETGDLTPRGKTIVDHTPMGRFGEPDELLGTLLWLASSASRFVTGIVVPVDGGFSAFSGV